MTTFTILTFYKFVKLTDLKGWRKDIQTFCKKNNVLGTILIAGEGINGTISGNEKAITAFEKKYFQKALFKSVEAKKSNFKEQPFYRLKILIKKEIVTFKNDLADPTETVGTYVSAQEWDKIISDPNVTLIDTRNEYEYQIGTFKGAVNPHTQSFYEFPEFVKNNLDPKKNKKIAMFCTGGIRCEKATSYMKKLGFEEVYHLKGGILKYLEQIPKEKSQWQGDCFVFDQRVAVTHGLKPGIYELCFGCGNPVGPEEKESPHFEQGICCPNCYMNLTAEKEARLRERQKQIELARKKGKHHLGQQFKKTGIY